jgi:hypothetical protein
MRSTMVNYEKLFDELITRAKSDVPPENSFTKKEFMLQTEMKESQARTFLIKEIEENRLLVMEYRGTNYYYFPA